MGGDVLRWALQCPCSKARHTPKLVVLTGGGKTAILELARKYFCRHIVFLPEAAGIVFCGGFPRIRTDYLPLAT